MTKPLSPAARAVYDAFIKSPMVLNHQQDDLNAIAAALRAAAKQVLPSEIDLPPAAPDAGHIRQNERRLVRLRLLNIATELEQLND